MKQSRTSIALKNSTISLLCQLFGIVLTFLCRTIFTYLLGQEYLGVNGLFSNILTILSFAELGIGNAIVYRLYAPIANDDRNRLRLFLRLYKRIYTVIIVVVALLGVSVIPFLDALVKAPNITESIRLLYCLYLANTIFSYVCVYKKSLLIADQKNYSVSIISQVGNMLMNLVQIVVLLITHNFILYLICQILFVLFENLACSWYADRKYPYIKEQISGSLQKEDISGLKKDVKGLMMTKIAATVLSGTDNIFISAFIGVGAVGILSNYTLILTTINSVMNKIFNSITATIGNLGTEGKPEQIEAVLNKIYFLNTSVYGYIGIGLILLLQSFVTSIWLDGSYYLSNVVVILATVELLFRSMHFPIHTTQLALGLFSQYRIIYVIAAVLNIGLDFALVRPLGIAGLLIATIVCRLMIYFTDIYVVYTIGLKMPMWRYIKMAAFWLIFIFAESVALKLLLSKLALPGILGFVCSIAVITVVYWLSLVLVFYKTEEFAYYRILILKLMRNLVNKMKWKSKI